MTIVKKIKLEDGDLLENEGINQGAQIIQQGGLVAFPTETVYGLGANALDGQAVGKIYMAKGRPSDNPLIVHIATQETVNILASKVTVNALKLMEAFWPGPLTLVFAKKEVIPDETSGGLQTVAIRFPENKIAQALIQKAQVPIAAPSANTSGKPSPTRASHVAFDLEGKVDMILDGGQCLYGLESTIVDVSQEMPCLLRPGSITKEMLESVVGTIAIDPSLMTQPDKRIRPKAPGMQYTHYAPQARVTIVSGEITLVVQHIQILASKAIFENSVSKKVGILATEQTKDFYDTKRFVVLVVGDRSDEKTIAANLFKMLRKFDYYGVEEVYAEGFPESDLFFAIMNRLKKAAGYNMIDVCSK